MQTFVHVPILVFFDFYSFGHVKPALCTNRCHMIITSSNPQDPFMHNLHRSPAGNAPYSQWRHRWNMVKSVPAYWHVVSLHSLHSISSFPFCVHNVTGWYCHFCNGNLCNAPGILFLCRFRNIRCDVFLSRKRGIRYNS